MFEQRILEEMGNDLQIALTHPLLSFRQIKTLKVLQKHRRAFEWFASLAIQLKNTFPYSPAYTINTSFNFSQDLGQFLYHNLNGDVKNSREFLSRLPFNIQKLISIIVSRRLVNMLSEEFLMSNMENFVPMSEIMLTVELPDFINSDEYEVVSLARRKGEPNTFPMRAIILPKHASSSRRVAYLVKNGSKVVSNITSGKLRTSIINMFSTTSFGVIGFVYKIKGYKHRQGFTPILHSDNFEDIKKLYMGCGENFDTVDMPVFTSTDDLHSLTPKHLFKLSSSEEFSKFILQHRNKNVVYVSKETFGFIRPTKVIETAKIVDWLLDEEYAPIGVRVMLGNVVQSVKFKVANTDLIVSGIKDRFIKVRKTFFGNACVAVEYAGVVPVWHPKHPSCKVCGGVEAKHYSEGVCSSCVYKFRKIAERCTPTVLLNINSCEDFVIIIDGVKFCSSPEGIVAELQAGFKKQLVFNFEEGD